MTRGIYQQGNWAVLQKDDGSRMAVQRWDYEASGYAPAFNNLETDFDFHVNAIGNRSDEPDPE